jgi:hypothetical protein
MFFGNNYGATNVSAWYWTFGDGTTSTQQNPVHTYASSGIYNVCLTIIAFDPHGNCCSRTYCNKVTVDCGHGHGGAQDRMAMTEENQLTLEITPNPFDLGTSIGFSTGADADLSLRVTNLMGVTVQDLFIQKHFDAGKYVVPFTSDNLPSGVYICELTDKTGRVYRKMVIQR